MIDKSPFLFRLSVKRNKDLENMMKNYKHHIGESRIYFIIDVASYLIDKLKVLNPIVKSDGKEWKYANDLKLAILDENENDVVLAVYLESRDLVIDEEISKNTVLYFKKLSKSPEWVNVLINHGPWPAFLLPIKVQKKHAQVIARTARKDEIASISARIFSRKDTIELELNASGAQGATIGDYGHVIGLSVSEDIGFNILRSEMGFLDSKSLGLWRQAFKDIHEYARECMIKVARYIVSGDKNIFNLPQNIGTMKTSSKDDFWFGKEIVKLLK